MSFSGIVGHRAVVSHLERAARDEHIPHALMLTGPDGVGKTAVARALAQVVLVASDWPGGLGAHPDFWIDDSTGERIGIERVRMRGRAGDDELSLQDFLSLRPYAGGRRVAILARADRLSEQAANCLLKTVEEPAASTHLILTTAFPERLPSTMMSRCQSLSCAPVAAHAIQEWLAGDRQVAAPLAATAAALAGGRPGRAMRLATEPGLLDAEVAAIDAFIAVAGTGTAGALKAAGELAPAQGAQGRETALNHVAAWTSFLRDVACVANGVPELVVWRAYRPIIEHWAEVLSPERVTRLLGMLVTMTEQLTQYAIPRLGYEMLFLDVFANVPAPPPTLDQRREVIVAGPPGGAPAGARVRTPGASRAASRRTG